MISDRGNVQKRGLPRTVDIDVGGLPRCQYRANRQSRTSRPSRILYLDLLVRRALPWRSEGRGKVIVPVPQAPPRRRKDRGLSELRKYPLCLAQMLKCGHTFFLHLVKQAQRVLYDAQLDHDADSPGRGRSRRECARVL